MPDPRARTVVGLLTQAQSTVASAESLTGGLVAAGLTSVPGASACFLGGVVAYDTSVKHQLLGVPEEVVGTHGVVSGPCAAAMAAGVRRLLGSDWGVATTGVAGPDRQEGKPVGTVFVAVCGPDDLEVRELSLAGDRGEIRAATVQAVLALLSAVLGSEHESSGRG